MTAESQDKEKRKTTAQPQQQRPRNPGTPPRRCPETRATGTMS